MVAAVFGVRPSAAQSDGVPAAPAEPASAPAAPATPAPAEVPAEAPVPPATPPSPAQADPAAGPAPAAPAPVQPPSTVAPTPAAPAQPAGRATSVPEPPGEDPSRVTTAVDASVPQADPGRVRFALELGAGLTGACRFRSDSLPRSNQEALDGAYGIGAFVGTRSALYGLAVELAGLGRDHYGSPSGNTTISASYGLNTLWLQGRWYFSEARPAFYLSAALGPALPTVRATGTRPSDTPLVAPPVPFECSETGKVGLGLAAGAGVEFDIARHWSLLGDARVNGHVLSRDSAEFGTCAPATGSALGGTARLGVQFRL